MFNDVLKTEWAKTRHSRVFFPVIVAPVLVVLLQYANFLVRYSSIVKKGDVPWTVFIEQHSVIWSVLILPILAAVLSGMLTMMETSDNNWKYLLTLPIKRGDVYFAKVILVIFLLIISTVILGVGMIVSSLILSLPGSIEFVQLIETLGAALLGGFAVITIQFWLSTRFTNPGVPLAISICGAVVAIFLVQSALTRWIPWDYPYLSLPIGLNDNINVLRYMIQSLLVGLLCLVVGFREFSRRDM